MTNLLVDDPFVSHSGLRLPFKIDGDALTDDDISVIARVIGARVFFGSVIGVARGGLRLADALLPYVTPYPHVLIVDDVLTTGRSMHELREIALRDRAPAHIIGVVLFARGPCPEWVTPFFTLHEAWR